MACESQSRWRSAHCKRSVCLTAFLSWETSLPRVHGDSPPHRPTGNTALMHITGQADGAVGDIRALVRVPEHRGPFFRPTPSAKPSEPGGGTRLSTNQRWHHVYFFTKAHRLQTHFSPTQLFSMWFT